MAAGGVSPHAFTASCSFALLSFARASGGARASDRAAGCPWGVPWGRVARVEVRRVWGIGGVVPMAAGGMDLCAITASCSFALPSFATASGGARASDRAACCSWGAPWGRGARVEVWRVLGVGGVVPMATGGVGLCAFSASCSFALLSFARASGGERASDRAACCSWGVPWSRDARVEVRKWWFGTTMSTDATEDDMDLARTEEADIHPFECSGIAEVKGCTRGLSFCLIGGAGGGKGGWEGTSNSLIVI